MDVQQAVAEDHAVTPMRLALEAEATRMAKAVAVAVAAM